MKVKIREDASEFYSVMAEDYGWDPVWESIFSRIKGKWIEVDINHLHKYEYYLKPIQGIFNDPLRIDEDYIAEIINDARYGKARCDFCNSISSNREVCSNCGNSNYLDPFFDDEEEKEHNQK